MNERYPEDTPRTNAVLRASEALGCGSIAEIPEGHPPSDPWELAREMERELTIHNKWQEKLMKEVQELHEIVTTMKGQLLL